jgi:hypothetical protein
MTTSSNTHAQLDAQLRRRLCAAVARDDANPRWHDVKRRARELEPRRPRQRLVLALAVATAIVAAPALAVATGVIDFSSSPSAPEPVKVVFGKLDAIDPLHGPGALTGQTKIVYTFHTASGGYDLAAAPSRDGWCWGIVGRDMTCNTPRSGLNYGYNQLPAVGNEPSLIDGSIAAAGVTRITLEFEDGRTVDLPFVQVSAPINADFFLYEIPPEHSTEGSRPSTIAAYNADETVVGSGWFIRESDAPVVGTRG